MFFSHFFEIAALLCVFHQENVVAQRPLIRLVGGTNTNQEGRVEVSRDGVQWGTVCMDGWNDLSAHVLCRSRGYFWGAAMRARYNFGIGSGAIFLDDVQCTGREPNLLSCRHRPWGEHNCVHTEDAAASCHTTNVRLVKGDGHSYGVLYVLNDDNKWAVQCADGFNDIAARVACKQLGFSHGLVTPPGTYGKLESPYIKYIRPGLVCTGRESNVNLCPYAQASVCVDSPYNYASVVCSNSSIQKTITNIGFDTRENAGVVMAKIAGVWGSVCGTTWSDNNANVICRENGFLGGVSYMVKPGKAPFILGSIHCLGNETHLLECARGSAECSHYGLVKTAGVLCYRQSRPVLRLIEERERFGRLEIEIDGQVGGICDSNWDVEDARVACRHLGYDDGDNIRGFSSPNSTKFIQNVECHGNEGSLFDCKDDGWNKITSAHCDSPNSFAGVECYKKVFLGTRQTTAVSTSGSVLIYHGNRWYHLCDQMFNTNESAIVCQELGYATGMPIISVPITDTNQFRIYFIHLNCSNAATIDECEKIVANSCYSTLYGATYASVMCVKQPNGGPNVRIIPPAGEVSSPVVEMYGIKGLVCGFNWNRYDATAYCKEFGYDGGDSWVDSSYVGRPIDSPVVWMTNMTCSTGLWETSLRDCKSTFDKTKGTCYSGFAVARCYKNVPTTTSATTSSNATAGLGSRQSQQLRGTF